MVKAQTKTLLVRFYNEVTMYDFDIAIPIYTVILFEMVIPPTGWNYDYL